MVSFIGTMRISPRVLHTNHVPSREVTYLEPNRKEASYARAQAKPAHVFCFIAGGIIYLLSNQRVHKYFS